MERQKTLAYFILFSFVFLRPIASISKVPLTAQTSIETSSLQNRNASTDYVASQSNNASKGNSTANTTKKLHSVVLQATQRRLLQAPSSILPYAPLKVIYNGKLCILFRARKLAIRYKNHTLVDLTERAFGPEAQVDTKGSFCSKDKATLMMRFGDVEDLRGLAIRLQMSTTFYESAGQNWFTLDNVHIHYNWTHEATFNSTDVYAPATNSYHCQHVSSLPKYDTLLIPSSNTDNAANWHITFTDFQIQAFNLLSNKFAAPSDCATFFTPAILMGLITSLILLLVLAYALHMVVHLKHIDRYEEHKTTVYFPRSSEAECMDKNSL